MTYDLDKIMKNRNCNYETAIEVAYDYFNETKAKAYEESEEEENED